MNDAIWLMRCFGWLAIAFGALVLSLWLFATRVPPPVQIQQIHYFPRGTT
jgi:hypothetical protein